MKSKKIQVLELLRFFSLTEVFLIHFMNDYIHSEEGLNIIMVSGQLGVAFFFMITGYLLIVAYKTNKKGFLWRKITQLLPKYEILLLLIFVAAKVAPSLFRTFEVSNANFIKSMLLIPYKTEGVPFACPMLPVAWTLEVQMALFVLFWLMMKLFKNIDKASVATVISLILVIIIGYIFDHNNIVLFTYGRFYMLYFVTGIGLALAERKAGFVKRIEEKTAVKPKRLPLFLCVILLFTFLLASCFYTETILCYALVSMSFVIAVILGKKVVFPNCILFMGKVSYSFFLIHYLICKIFTRVLHFNRNFLTTVVMLVVCYILVVLVSYIFDKIINRIMSYVRIGKNYDRFDSNNTNQK